MKPPSTVSAKCSPQDVPLKSPCKTALFRRFSEIPMSGSIGTRLCAKGAAAKWLLHDTEKPARPQIRTGPRGSGQWRDASWDEAYAYVAEAASAHQRETRPESILVGWRGSLNTTSSPKLSHAAWALPMISPTNSVCPLSLHTACQATLEWVVRQ